MSNSSENSTAKKISYILTNNFDKVSLFAEMIIIFVTFQIVTDGLFLTTRNMSNLLMQGATCSIIAVTMMLVIVSQNADLSAGSALGFIGCFAAAMQVQQNVNTPLTILAVLAVGVVIGLWHGFWIGYKKLPAFIVTYASQLIFKGGTLLIGDGMSIGPVSDSFSVFGNGYLPKAFLKEASFNDLSLFITILIMAIYLVAAFRGRMKSKKTGTAAGSDTMFALKTVFITAVIFVVCSIMVFQQGFSYAVIILAILGLLFAFIVKYTPFGRYVFAVGGNAEAAKLSGISVEKTVMMIYIFHSVVTAIASIVFLGRVGQATASAGTSFEFIAITGCVVGGTSILGGRGNVLGAIIGTMIMTGLDNGMSLLNLGATWQYIVKGLVLMLAIALDVMSKRGKAN
ncbi:sugar ABC transporter permease [Luxibacter massiliensis]|uniref:sugar ABC transporter permease n=1 Tax=Luxibacter massiliensis TaxID=2219695 RepID=UPI000F069042|nr:sugar ABC transporter permease [Luxibacter massiliensis]